MRGNRLERLLRLGCALYPRDFRSLLAADMAELYAREAHRIHRQRGRAAALRYVVGTLLSTFFGALPARLAGIARPRIQMETLLQDVRFALRDLIKSPAFTAVAVASLALGIGANTAIFSVVDAVLLRGLPYADADRLVVLWEQSGTLGLRTGPSGPTFLDWRERASAFEDMTLFQPGSATVTGLEEPEQVPGMRVTVNFLAFLGYEPARGRDFAPSESAGGRADVALVSHGFAQRLAGDRSPVGERLMGDHVPYTIVGVLPPDFWYPLRTDMFVPWDEDELRAQSRRTREYAALARLRPGVTLEQAVSEMREIAAALASEHPEMAGWSATVTRAHEETTAFLRPALLVLLGAVGFVLLIACANVANLLLARSARRRAEIAVRAAVGASRGRLLRQLLTESVVLAGVGGLLGLAVGRAGVAALDALLPTETPLPGGDSSILLPAIQVDAPVMLFTALVALATGILFGLLPAWQGARVDLASAMRSTRPGGSAAGGRARGALVTVEVALAVVLLVGVAMMIQTFWNLQRVDPGFRPDGLLTMQVELPTDSRYRTDPEQADFYARVLAELRAIPGVEAAGLSEVLPLDSSTRRADVIVHRSAAPSPEGGVGVDYNIASDGYFRALGIPLARGRSFEPTDDLDHPWVAVVDETFAATHLADREPVGERIEVWGLEFEIVGVVGAIRGAGLDEQPRSTVYFHYLQAPDNRMSFAIRGRGGAPEGMVDAAKKAVWRVDPDQPVYNIRRMDAVVAAGTSSRRLTLSLLSIFASVAVLMSALGVYGVISYANAQRARELGLRLALGADRTRLLRMVVGEGMGMAARGVILGLVGAIAATRFLSSLLYGVSAADPLPFAAVGLLLFAVAIVAAWLPARRAAAVDPARALRGS